MTVPVWPCRSKKTPPPNVEEELMIEVWRLLKNEEEGDFPGGTVSKNLPANGGDTGSIPGLGRSHMPQRNKARAPQLLSQRSRARAPQQEKPLQWEARAPQWRVAPTLHS